MGIEIIHEQVTQRGDCRVDNEAGVIRNVRILGPKSANGRRYLPEAIRNARGLYEGRAVNVNHPPRMTPDGDRKVEDRIGWLQAVAVRDDGLNGCLYLLKSHPFTAVVLEAAERNPQLLGLSHNAEGKTKREYNVIVVEEIISVRSVDLVADPASTPGLFESRDGFTALHDRPGAAATAEDFLRSITGRPPKADAVAFRRRLCRR